MKRVLALGVLAAAVVAASFVARADAIIGGTPDGNAHKGVGYVVFYDKHDDAALALHRLARLDARRADGWALRRHLRQRERRAHARARPGLVRQGDQEPGQLAPAARASASGAGPAAAATRRRPEGDREYVGSTADGSSHDLGVVRALRPEQERRAAAGARSGSSRRRRRGR